MCGFYSIAFIEYMVAGKTLLDYTNLFPPNNCKKNDKIIYKYFQDKYGRRSKSWVSIKKNWCKYLNYIEHLLILASTVTCCVSVPAFALLVCFPVGSTSSLVRIKNCPIIAGIKKYKSIKKEKKRRKSMIKVKYYWISNFYEFVSVDNMLREYYEMKEGIKSS